MPATEVTDYFFQAVPLWVGKVAAAGVASDTATTIPALSAVGLTEGNAYIVTVNRVNAAGTEKNPANQRETFIGKLSGSNFINCIREVEGEAQAWEADTVLEILVTATTWNKLIEGVETELGGKLDATDFDIEHNADGTHKSSIVALLTATQTLTNKTLTKPKTVQKYEDWANDTDGATITLDLSAGNLHRVTLGGNRTIAFSNPITGQAFILRAKQDGTGGRTLTWPSGISWPGSAAPDQPKTANKTDVYGFVCTDDDSANSFANPTFDGFVIGNEVG